VYLAPHPESVRQRQDWNLEQVHGSAGGDSALPLAHWRNVKGGE